MSIIIVTKNQYVVASKIHHIILNEHTEYHDLRSKSGKMYSTIQHYYNINVIYTPDSAAAANTPSQFGKHSNDEWRDCTVQIRKKVDAYKVYADLIQQIREQMPDALFLDKAMERLLGSMDFETMQKDDNKHDSMGMMEAYDDRSAKKARSPRKAKRPSKKVLRGPSKGNGRR